MKEATIYSEEITKLNLDEQKAEALYRQIVEEDKDKTYLDVLPADFKNFKRSIIKRVILHQLDETTNFLNSCPLFNGRVFDKKEVARYMMIGTKYSNFHLANKFIPRKSEMDVWTEFYVSKDRSLSEEDQKLRRDEFRALNEDRFEVYHELEHHLQLLKQNWNMYEDRQKIKAGKLVHSYDIESDGFPRASRGNLCYLFIPVKGKWPQDANGTLKLYNPRSKKYEYLKIIKYKADDDIYMCEDRKGNKVFLASHDDVENAYSDLFDVNKEIYSGWWNKSLILK